MTASAPDRVPRRSPPTTIHAHRCPRDSDRARGGVSRPVVATVPDAEAAVPSTLPSDQSGQLPVTERGEAVGDFMGRGTQRPSSRTRPTRRIEPQRLRLRGARQCAAADHAGAVQPWITPYTWNFGVVDGWTPYEGGLKTVPMVWTPEALYIGGYIFNTADKVVFRTNPNGTCAQPSCATGPPTG